MASKTLSFRMTNAEIELLEAFQVPEDESIHQTAVRLLRELIGASSANTTHGENIKELIAEKIEQAASARAIDREFVRDEIDERTAYLAIAIESLKTELKQLEEKILLTSTGREETSTQEPIPALPQESAIASKETKALKPNCPHCGGESNKHGKGKTGNPRFRCKSCLKTFEEE